MEIDNNWIKKNINSKSNKDYIDHALDYTSTAAGSYRITQLMQKSVCLFIAAASSMGSAVSVTTRNFANNLNTGLSALGFATLPGMTSAAIRSISAVQVEDGALPARKYTRAYMNTANALNMYAACISFIQGFSPLGTLGKVLSISTNTLEAKISYDDYYIASDLELRSQGEVQKAVSYSKHFHLLGVIKAVTALALAVLSLLFILTGIAVIPVIAIAALSLFSVLVAIKKDFLKMEAPYTMIDFDSEVRV